MNATRQVRIAIGLLGALGAAFLLARYGTPPKAVLHARLVAEAQWWGAFAALLAYVFLVEQRPPSSIGLRRPGWRDTAIALGAGLLIVAGTVAIYMVLFPVLLLSISISHIPNTMLMPYWYRAAMVVRMAVAGELLFRVYAIERGEELLPGGGKWIGAALSLAVFIAANWFSWSPVESIATFFGGIVLTALYLWRRNLAVNAIASFIALGTGYLGS